MSKIFYSFMKFNKMFSTVNKADSHLKIKKIFFFTEMSCNSQLMITLMSKYYIFTVQQYRFTLN